MTKDDHQLKDSAFRLMKHNPAAALGTVDDKRVPHVATVYCVTHSDFMVYFVTRVEARKYNNILQQPIVALGFFNEAEMDTVQLTGKAERIEDIKQEQPILYELMVLRYKEHEQVPPPMQLFEHDVTTELAVVRIVPYELTYATFKRKGTGQYQPFFHKII